MISHVPGDLGVFEWKRAASGSINSGGYPGPHGGEPPAMRRRHPPYLQNHPWGIWQATLGLLVLCAATLSIQGCSKPPPNLILITVDTLRADHIGAYGGPVPTPAMDLLAQEGVLVEGACTPTPTTGPAHASLMSGLYVWNHGILLNAVSIADPELPNLTEHLQAAGIKTAAFVSSFNVDEQWGFGRGFESFHFEPTREMKKKKFWSRGEATTTAALNWLEEHSGERFFIWIHYFDPHAPYEPPDGFERPESEEIDLEGKEVPPKFRDFAHLKQKIRAYRGEVTYTDAQVERLLRGLRSMDIYDNTAIVLTADHGEGLGDHGHMGHGWNLFDELITVPLIVRGPGLPAGRRVQGPAQLEDLMPTILSLAQVEIPGGLDGVDLLGWLRGTVPASPRTAVYGRRAAFPEVPVLFFERRWPRKWIGELAGPGQAYHLDRDVKEQAAVEVQEPPDELLDRLVDSSAVPRERVLDDETRRALEALGYL